MATQCYTILQKLKIVDSKIKHTLKFKIKRSAGIMSWYDYDNCSFMQSNLSKYMKILYLYSIDI